MQSELWDRFRFFLNCNAIKFEQQSRTEFKLYPRGQPERLAVEQFVKQVFIDEVPPMITYDFSEAKIESYWMYRKAISDLQKVVEDNKGFLDIGINGASFKIFFPDENSKIAIKQYVLKLNDRRFQLDEAGEKSNLLSFSYAPIYQRSGLNETLFLHIQDEMQRFADQTNSVVSAEGHQEFIVACPDVETVKRFKSRFVKYCELKVIDENQQEISLKISCCIHRKLA